jgi:hypothetical protein
MKVLDRGYLCNLIGKATSYKLEYTGSSPVRGFVTEYNRLAESPCQTEQEFLENPLDGYGVPFSIEAQEICRDWIHEYLARVEQVQQERLALLFKAPNLEPILKDRPAGEYTKGSGI